MVDVIARFWAKVERRGSDDCWRWQAGSANGYGQFNAGGKRVLAHRFAWLLTHGPIPGGVLVLHSCDNPPCCNPAHLFLGDHQANYDDSLDKGRRRWVRGERHHKAKLTWPQVNRIREQRAQGVVLRLLAAEHGVSVSTVHRIVRGEYWQTPREV